MPSHYSNILIGFLSTRPGPDATGRRGEPWEAELPLDDIHKEAVRLGLIESAGRAQRAGGAERGSRPFRLTETGLELRQGARDAKRRDGDAGPTMADYGSGDSGVHEVADPITNRDGLIGLAFFVCLIGAGVFIAWLMR